MPVKVKEIDGKYRIVGPDGRIERTSNGEPRDGGGHNSEERAKRQAAAINLSERGKGR